MIKAWAFEFFPASEGMLKSYGSQGSAGQVEQKENDSEKLIEYFNFFLDLWARAEIWGYEGIFLSEHHFGGGYSPSPNLLIPVIAQRTKTLRIGVMGMVVPYHNAWRIVEEIGMLDVLTGGRLEVGTSAGIPHEFARIGMSTDEARARYEEALTIIDAGMRQSVLSHKGKYWNFENLTLVPRPVQQPQPPMWTTVMSVESARKAARRGSKITTGFVPTEKAKEVFDAYNEEATKFGNPAGPQQVGLRRQIVMDLDETASGERSSQYAKAFRSMLEGRDKRAIAPGRKALDAPGTHTYTLGDDEFIGGSPKDVAAQIIDQCRRCGAGHFQVVFAGHESLDQLAGAWKAFGTEVIPELKQA